MDKNTGGAKPKTGARTSSNNSRTRINSNNSSSSIRQDGSNSSSSSQTTGSQPRNRSPRREHNYAARSSGVGLTGLRSNAGSRHVSDRPSGDSTSRRSSVPNSVARSRLSSSTQTQNNTTRRTSVNNHSPTRGSRTETRNQQRQNVRTDFSQPVLRHRHVNLRSVEPVSAPLESPMGDLPQVSPLPGISSSTSDSEASSPMSPSQPPEDAAASLEQLSALRPDTGRPMSSSRDAILARELLQAEMDMMMERDEELARQLQDDFNNDSETTPLAYPLSMFVPGGLQARARHFPSVPGRMEGGRGARGTDHRSPRALRLFRGPDGAVRMGFDLPGRGGGGLRLVMRAGPRGGRVRTRPAAAESESAEDGSRTESEPTTSEPDEEGNLPAGEFDPDERLLADGSEAPDNFLSVMNDPSLMLLMLLLRAPDSLYQNEGGVDLEDYEGLWELAERLGEVQRRGISEDQINRLPMLKFKESKAEGRAATQCQICLVDFENGDCLRCIPCKHDFHKDCIDEWLKRNATCPICRQGVKPSDA